MTTHEQLIRAVQKATRRLVSSGNFDLLLKDVLVICVEAVGASGGTIYVHDSAAHRLKFQHVLPEDIADRLPTRDIADDFGMAGAAFQERTTICRTFALKPESEWNAFERATGVPIQSMVATPLMMEDETPIGVVQLLNKVQGCFTDTDCAVLDTIAAVSTMAYMNSRLTEESTRASTLLGMGKVGHDIGNLAASLYATVSYSDLAMTNLKLEIRKREVAPSVEHYIDTLDPMFYDLKTSVERIVRYSRLISDMSAGRALRPNKRVAFLATTIQTSTNYLSAEARSRRVGLFVEIDETAPATLFDELYVFRIVQNLVGNAIKAVQETVPKDWRCECEDEDDPPTYGDVHVRYRFENDRHIIEVQDSGPGISQETIERILTGNARSQWDKASGSGWGTKIVLELAQTHDARVAIESTPGHGATFRISIPHCGD